MMSSENCAPGIDIQQALEILAARSSCQHRRDEEASPNAQNLGQVLDMSGSSDGVPVRRQQVETLQKQHVQKKERAQRQRQLQQKLNSMEVNELLQTILEAQQERVRTYREYDRGLEEQVLSTGNLTHYPSLCAEATASFAVLSDTIRGAQTVLDEKYRRKELVKLVAQLQDREKEKLNWTAALHLERIREGNHHRQSSLSGHDSSAIGGDTTIAALMKKDVRSLQQKIAASVQDINDLLEELRCNLLEEKED